MHNFGIRGLTICSHEDGHYQCSFSSYTESVHFVKRPLNGDCRDLASMAREAALSYMYM